jgi:hypothetical protein
MFTHEAYTIVTDIDKQMYACKPIMKDLKTLDLAMVIKKRKGDEVKTRDLTEAGKLAPSRSWYYCCT